MDWLTRAIRSFEPRPRIAAAEWFGRYVQTHEGRPYDHGAYPHLAAPGGPCDALDDPRILTIWLQWASRLGKTFFGQAALCYLADTNPAQMLCASEAEKTAKEVVRRTYAMLDRNPRLRDRMPPKHRRKQDYIALRDCGVFVAWSRSAGTLADKAIRWGHANEIDKWEHEKTSKEADPLKLFDDRFKEFSQHKKIKESTPALKHASRVEAGRLQSTNCKFYVPCPHCGHYQTLTLERIRWDKRPDGKSEAELAAETARYYCEACEEVCHDHDRPRMMRRGVWVPEGCGVEHQAAAALFDAHGAPVAGREWRGWSRASWVTGQPVRDGIDAGYQLSSIYALTLTWGGIAREFLKCKEKPQYLRNFVNSWLGETWEAHRSKSAPETLGDKLAAPESQRGVCPAGVQWITVGVDKQARDGGIYPFVVLGWGEQDRSWLIEWGEAESTDELLSDVIHRHWPHADGGGPIQASLTLIDSGYATKEVYDFCAPFRHVVACKGSSTMHEPWRKVLLGMGESRDRTRTAKSSRGQLLIHINTDYWETELQARLDDRKPGDPASLTLPETAAHDLDLCEQLLNGVPADRTDNRGFAKLLWVKRWTDTPNDYRDALRYAMAAAKAFVDERQGRIPQRTEGRTARAGRVISAGERRPDGREWL